MRSAARRLVVWIGKRVCPDPHALLPASEDVVGCVGDDVQPSERDNAYAVDLAGRSVFVDGPGGIRSRSVATGRSAGGEDRSVRQAIERGWCAEEALRQGAADAIVIDGSDLPEVSWRRLHLAAADAAHPALVLVVMPPVEAPGTLRVSEPRTSRLGRCCATRWDVAPMSSCMEFGEDGGSGFRWRAVLRHIRHIRHMRHMHHLQHVQHVRQRERGARTTVPREASESGPSERMAAVEGGRITFEIRAPRALHGDAAWHMVHEHLARRRAAAQACASLSQAFPAGREQGERYARSA